MLWSICDVVDTESYIFISFSEPAGLPHMLDRIEKEVNHMDEQVNTLYCNTEVHYVGEFKMYLIPVAKTADMKIVYEMFSI